MLTFLVFFLALGGSIFIHELGHFLAARAVKIPVEEFGMGLPPRIWRFWRLKGRLKVGNHEFIIPSNFELPFEREDGLNRGVDVTARREGETLVLESIQLAALEDGKFQPQHPNLVNDADGRVRLSGILREADPGTEFTLNGLPLGGFVRPRGENDPNVPDGLAAATPWRRLVVLFAGPLMNLVSAIFIFALVVSQTGAPVRTKVNVMGVEEGSPAAQAGFQKGDIFVTINGETIERMDEARAMIRANLDQPVTFVMERDGKQITLTATPLSTRPAQSGALGVGLGNPIYKPAHAGEALVIGFAATGEQAMGILRIPLMALQGLVSPEEGRMFGLKGIFDLLGVAMTVDGQAQAAPAGGAAAPQADTPQQVGALTLNIIASLAVSLGVFNLLPIPALDGGRILFTFIEIIFRRRIPYRLENAVNGAAFLLLIGLMLVVNVMDFVNPVDFSKLFR